MYRGDLVAGQVIRFRISTFGRNNLTTIFENAVIGVFRGDSKIETIEGVTISINHGDRIGLHLVTIDTSVDTAFYQKGYDYDIIIMSGSVDGVILDNTTIGSFSIENRNIPSLGNVKIVVS